MAKRAYARGREKVFSGRRREALGGNGERSMGSIEHSKAKSVIRVSRREEMANRGNISVL